MLVRGCSSIFLAYACRYIRVGVYCDVSKEGAQDKQFYRKMVPLAEAEFKKHLKSEGFN
jgi:hypothetical protein